MNGESCSPYYLQFSHVQSSTSFSPWREHMISTYNGVFIIKTYFLETLPCVSIGGISRSFYRHQDLLLTFSHLDAMINQRSNALHFVILYNFPSSMLIWTSKLRLSSLYLPSQEFDILSSKKIEHNEWLVNCCYVISKNRTYRKVDNMNSILYQRDFGNYRANKLKYNQCLIFLFFVMLRQLAMTSTVNMLTYAWTCMCKKN